MGRAARAVVGVGVGYLVGAVLGYAMVVGASGNTHDRGLEAAMTAAFVVGPVGAVVGLIIGIVRGRGRNQGGARVD